MVIWYLWLALTVSCIHAATLFNGSEALVMPAGTPPGCLNAFSTVISCDQQLIQLLVSPDDHVGWTTSQLQTLCTPSCNSSLSTLRSQVASACGSQSFYYGTSGNLSYTTFVDLRQYKYQLACMQDASSKQYCLDAEKGWNVSALVATGKVQWPKNTTKIYPDFLNPGSMLTFPNGTSLPMEEIAPQYYALGPNGQNAATPQGNMAGQDWYVNRTGTTYSNYGWPYPLNFDEYPTQIQCSSCFLQKLEYGIASTYGNMYDDIMAQVWANIQANCGITTKLKPANNFSNYNVSNIKDNYTGRSVNGTALCQQYLKASDPSQNASMLSVAGSVPLAAILELNDISNEPVGSAPLCAPLSCKLGIVPQAISARNYVASQSGITLLQFLNWNPHAHAGELLSGESVCIGPPGGAYQPAMATAANATVYSTTAHPVAPTLAGTIPYCGLWYNVTTGDYCNLLSQKFGITLDQLINMNTAIFRNCSNLYLGYDYCMAPCCGSSIPSSASTTAPPASSTMSATGTSTYASPPGPTQSGASNKCYKWYLTQSGDYCSKIESTYGISQAQFNYWNPEVDANCDIQAGVAYCVNGPPLPSSTSSAKTTTTTTTGK